MADLLTDSEFEKFRKLIYDESGITFSDTNRSVLDSRIKERLREEKLNTVEEYYARILADKEELKLMLDSVTTNLTRFFRNQPHFDALVNYVIPKLLEVKKNSLDKTIRIWSAGCSTGEEPYTIAMILKDILPAPYDFSITASDISLKSLMVGRQGFYTASRIVGIPEKYLDRFFTKSDTGYQVKKELMDKIRMFHLQLEQLVGSFYGNHYAVELKVLHGSSIYVGIHDSEMTIGSTCWSHGTVKELMPKENKDKRIRFSFKK